MKNNFDEIIERKNTDSLKYDFVARLGKPEGILPLWVADMDFKSPSCVIDALIEKSRHGILATQTQERIILMRCVIGFQSSLAGT